MKLSVIRALASSSQPQISLEPALSTKLTTEVGGMKNCEVICWSVYSDLNRAVAKLMRRSSSEPFSPIS
ncbi:hypothetical protein D3C81_1673170 [compost metagenome]